MKTAEITAVVVGFAAIGMLGYHGYEANGEDWPILLALAGIGCAVVLWFAVFRGADGNAMPWIALGEMAEAANEACMVTDAKGWVVWQGGAWRNAIGPAQRLEQNLDDLAHGDIQARDRLAALAEGATSGRSGLVEIQHERVGAGEGSGGSKWLAVAANPISGAGGRVLWRVRDAGLHGADALRSAVARLEALVDGSPFGAIECDSEGRLLYINRVFARWIGERAEEVVGRGLRISDFVRSGDVEDGGRWNLIDRSGRSISAIAVEVDAGGADRRRFVLTDQATERAWEAALIRAEERYRHLVELAPVGIATVDRAGRLLEANIAFCDMVGIQESELVGTPFVNRFSTDVRPEVAAWTAASAKSERPKPLDAPLLGESGRPVQLWSGGGEAEARLVIYVIDMSDRRNLEQRFAHAQKMQAVGQMAGGIAHDFNNLLTAMIGHCDLLLLRHHAGDPSFADILQIKQNANRAASLVRQLLAFSRQQTLRPRVVDIGDTMSEIANLLRRLIGQRVKLDLAAARELGFVRVDPGQLEQVIVNLAVNARDAMPKGGNLAIRLSHHVADTDERLSHENLPAGDYLRIDIADTGEGIQPEHMDKIFEPFFTTKAVGAGTGLGLSTVYGIVKQTGGHVSVKSRRGAGTTFSIYLPRIAPNAKEARETEAEAETAGQAQKVEDLTGSASVLLAEDEFAVRSFAARALRNKGYTVIEAEDGEAALASIERVETPIDLMITDVLMPNIDGPTLIRRARALRPGLKVIVISGYAEDAFRQELGTDQNLGFLPKPFSLKDLAARVKDALGE